MPCWYALVSEWYYHALSSYLTLDDQVAVGTACVANQRLFLVPKKKLYTRVSYDLDWLANTEEIRPEHVEYMRKAVIRGDQVPALCMQRQAVQNVQHLQVVGKNPLAFTACFERLVTLVLPAVCHVAVHTMHSIVGNCPALSRIDVPSYRVVPEDALQKCNTLRRLHVHAVEGPLPSGLVALRVGEMDDYAIRWYLPRTLQELEAACCRGFTPAGLRGLPRTVQKLNLSLCLLGDEGAQILTTTLPSIHSLDITGCGLTDQGIHALLLHFGRTVSVLKVPQNVYLSQLYTEQPRSWVQLLANRGALLQHLSCTIQLHEAHFLVTRLPWLLSLTISGHVPRGTTCQEWTPIPQKLPLRHLDLTAYLNLTDERLEQILRCFPALVSLDIRGCTMLTRRVLEDVVPRFVPLLRELTCSVRSLRVPQFTQLHTLRLYSCTDLTDAILLSMVRGCSRLRHLCIRSAVLITDHGLCAALAHLPKLRYLDASLCRRVEGDFLCEITPGIRSLDLSFTHTDDQALLHMAKLRKLEALDISWTRVSARGLRDALGHRHRVKLYTHRSFYTQHRV